MLVKINRGWIYIIGYKVARSSLPLNSNNFSTLWEMLSSISQYISLRFDSNSCLLLLVIFEKNLNELIIKANKLIKQFNAIISIHTITTPEIKLQKLVSNKNDHRSQKKEINKSSDLSDELKRINFPYIKKQKKITLIRIDKGIVKLPNNRFRTVVSFKMIEVNGSLVRTLNALTKCNATLLVGSNNYGQQQYLSIEIVSLSLKQLYKTRIQLIEMLKINPNLTGNIEIIKYKYLDENIILSILGIGYHTIDNNIIRQIINSIPECMKVDEPITQTIQ